MRICLITEVYPAVEQSDAASMYITKLAKGLTGLTGSLGLAENGNQITVICARNHAPQTSESGIRVIEVENSKRLSNLQLAPLVMPEATKFAHTQLNYWHALADILQDGQFDVVETTFPLAATLLSAMTRETATVVRIEDAFQSTECNFDVVFQNMIVNYALSCVDAYSSPQSAFKNIDSERICINNESNSQDLALRAMQIYEIAIKRYENTGRPELYRHGSQRLIKSSEDMIALYDKMLYDLLFRVSYRFRIMHWWRALCSNPDAFTSKLRQKLFSRP
jgi:hypothetical protein